MGEGIFRPGPAMPGRRSDFACIAEGRSLYVAGGCVVPREAVAETWVLDLEKGTWRPSAPMASPREGMASTRDGDWLVTAGGYCPGTEVVPTVEAFHLREERWEKRPSLPAGLAWARAVVAGPSVHVAGGFRIDPRNADTPVSEHLVGTLGAVSSPPFHEATPLPLAIADGVFAPLPAGERLVWTGGALRLGAWRRENLYSQPVTGATWAFDLFHRTWLRLPEDPVPRRAHRAVALPEGILVAGGVDDDTEPLSSAHLLTPEGVWHELAPLPAPRYHFGMALAGEEIWVLGGNYAEGAPPPTLHVRVKDWLSS